MCLSTLSQLIEDLRAEAKVTNTLTTPATDEQSGPAERATASYPLIDIMTGIRETAYVWDLASDRVHWSRNAADVLGVSSVADLSSGQGFHLSIASEHAGARNEAITTAGSCGEDEGRTYRVQYRFMPEGRRSAGAYWMEDQGTLRPGQDGKPGVACGVIRRIDERREEDQRLRFLSDHDELTGLMNRTRLNSAIASVISEAKSRGHSSTLLLIAIDNLGLVNETFGFDVGDETIRIIGQRLAELLRGGDAIGRFSSNKFGVIVNECETVGLSAVVKRLQDAVRDKPIETSQCRFSATVSVGALLMPRDADTPQKATACVLHALETAKSARQDNFAVYVPNAQNQSIRQRNIKIAEDVIAAIDEDRMRIALQPIVRTDTREAAFHECLLRMEMPDGRIETAGYFIPLAEQLGLSRLIDQRALELTVNHVRRHPDLHVSLNVSGLTATNHAWLVALDRLTGADRSITNRITVEITETAAIQDLDESVNFVDALKELGCKVAIDDFGAGYTSFRNLKVLGVDMVKIDGAFVANLKNDADDRVFVTKLAELADHFGMETVAEWVGDEETANFLRDIGINYLQGFYFGEPELAAREKVVVPVEADATAAIANVPQPVVAAGE